MTIQKARLCFKWFSKAWNRPTPPTDKDVEESGHEVNEAIGNVERTLDYVLEEVPRFKKGTVGHGRELLLRSYIETIIRAAQSKTGVEMVTVSDFNAWACPEVNSIDIQIRFPHGLQIIPDNAKE